jgi:hypothetical protein
MIRLTVLAFVLALVVLGAMSVLGQSNDPCNQPIELIPDYCFPQPSPLPQATAWPTVTAWVRPYPGPDLTPYPFPAPATRAGTREGVQERNSFLKTFLAFITR